MRTFATSDFYAKSIAVSADGKIALWYVNNQKNPTLWDLIEQKPISYHFIAENGHIAHTPSFKEVYSVSRHGGGFQVWHSRRKTCLITMNSAVDPDGNLLLLEDKQFAKHDAGTQRPIQVFKGHTDTIQLICISPNRKFAATGGADKTLRIWDLRTSKCVTTLTGHSEKITAVQFSSDMESVVYGDDVNIYKWDTKNLFKENHYQAQYELVLPRTYADLEKEKNDIVITVEDIKVALTAGDYESAAEILLNRWKEISYADNPLIEDMYRRINIKGQRKAPRAIFKYAIVQPKGPSGVRSASFSKDGKLILAESEDTTIRIWDSATKERKHTLRQLGRFASPFDEFMFSPDSKRIYTPSDRGSVIHVFDVETCKEIDSFNGNSIMSISPNGKYAVCSTGIRIASLMNLEDKSVIEEMENTYAGFDCAAFSQDSNTFVAVSGEKLHSPRLDVWHIKANNAGLIPGRGAFGKGQKSRPKSRMVTISPNARQILLAGESPGIDLFKLKDKNVIELQTTLEAHEGHVNVVCFSPDSRFAVSGGEDTTVRIWDLTGKTSILTLSAHSEGVTTAHFSPDGNWIISGSNDGFIILWRVIWEFDFSGKEDGHEYVRPYLEIFLNMRHAKWTEDDFQALVDDLAEKRGLGWVPTQNVRELLENMTAAWEHNVKNSELKLVYFPIT